MYRKFYGDRPTGTAPSRELNPRGLAKYSDLDLSKAIHVYRKRCNIRDKLVLMTNRKSHTSIRLVPKSVTLDDLEWPVILRYFSEIGTIRGALRRSCWRYSQTFCDRNVVQSFLFLAIYHWRWYDVGNPSIGGLNARGVAKYSDCGWKWCKTGSKLVLVTNRKSHMNFQLLPKLVTLNDLERCNGPYFALFYRICVYDVRKNDY